MLYSLFIFLPTVRSMINIHLFLPGAIHRQRYIFLALHRAGFGLNIERTQ